MDKTSKKLTKINPNRLKSALFKAETQSILRSLEAEYRRPMVKQQSQTDQPDKHKFSLGEDEERNPLCVFEAILVAHDRGAEFPPWVCEYLYTLAWAMLEVVPQNANELIKNALGFRDYSQCYDRERFRDMESYVAAYARKVSDPKQKLTKDRAQFQAAKEFRRTVGKRKGISARRGNDWCAS